MAWLLQKSRAENCRSRPVVGKVLGGRMSLYAKFSMKMLLPSKYGSPFLACLRMISSSFMYARSSGEPSKPGKTNDDSSTAALYYAQLFNKKEHCKGPFVWSCEDCGLPIYNVDDKNITRQCVKVLVREKLGAAEKRGDNGRFSFDKVVSPPPSWQKYDGFEIRLLKFIAEYHKFYIALHHWEDFASVTDQADNVDDSVNASTAKVDPDIVAKRVVISLVSRGEYHLGSGSFTMGQHMNNSPVDYSEGFYSMQVVLIQRLPPASKEVESIPFEPKILFIAVGTLLVVSAAWNRIKSLIAWKEGKNPKMEGSLWYRYVSDLLEMFSSIFDQDMFPAQSGRQMILAGGMILISWWGYVIIFRSLYTALMTSKMSISYRIAPVAGLEQLASRSDLVPIVMRDSVLKDWLEVQCICILRHISFCN
ncbi:hypothetical protein RvY_12290 [Ramazzottius varieornatus]|uniref:Ionotropic glutamate receptor C-terminal domain-containing protein n=1 Tax=Ramazzottius varieornatus TaxID=947166 RepID=A0A1D1VJ05_RAMVA|nr:hypothetical protein RvY_12290 [Ramazzottius varieornatus]